MVKLNQWDCSRKLQTDLLHLFICNPTDDLSLPVRLILDFYSDCHGHNINPSVYGCDDVLQLMRSDAVAEIIEVLNYRQYL